MKKYLRYAAAGLGLGLMTMAAAIPPSIAQVPKNFPPRYLTDQQTTYTRFMVNFNSCQAPVTPFTCSFKVGAVPFNTYLLRGSMQVYTPFTGTGVTAMTASIGTGQWTPTSSPNIANIVAPTSVFTSGNAGPLTIVPTSLGTGNTAGAPPGVLGNASTLPGGTNGGFDLWVTLIGTGAFPTVGSAVMILEYVLPNDGACTAAPTVPTQLPGGGFAVIPGC
jgi:hypothetical protein